MLEQTYQFSDYLRSTNLWHFAPPERPVLKQPYLPQRPCRPHLEALPQLLDLLRLALS